MHLFATRFRLEEDFRVGANDLLGAYRAGHFGDDLDDFAASVEHLAFYLRSEQATGIKSPKAWFLKQLRAGYYPSPAGFVSWEEQQVEAKLAAQQEKVRRLQELEAKLFNSEFEAWLASLAAPERTRLLAGSIVAHDPNSMGARALLREAFADTRHASGDTSINPVQGGAK